MKPSPAQPMSFHPFSQKWRPILALTSCLFFAAVSSGAAEQKPADKAAAGATAKSSTTTEQFVFGGGDLRGFIEQVKKHFGVDLFDLATIEVPINTRVPKMRVARGEVVLVRVLDAYNSMAEHGLPRLGRWYYEGPAERPDIVTLTAPEDPSSKAANRVKLRVFSVKGLSNDERQKLIHVVDEGVHQIHELDIGRGVASATGSGHLRINESTDLLMATGSEAFLEVVEEVVREYRSQQPGFQSDRTPSKAQEIDSKKP
ncbi:MAG: hypothetical protein L0Z50_05505 [Verrucomicrobiales bacterium]|nr:hypothetical protein [Verrucomicrobiales bacterium]